MLSALEATYPRRKNSVSKTALGRGCPNQTPWIKSSCIDRTSRYGFSVSTPSIQTWMPTSWQSSTIHCASFVGSRRTQSTQVATACSKTHWPTGLINPLFYNSGIHATDEAEHGRNGDSSQDRQDFQDGDRSNRREPFPPQRFHQTASAVRMVVLHICLLILY